MKPIQVQLESDVHTALKVLAAQRHTTVSEIIRVQIARMLQESK